MPFELNSTNDFAEDSSLLHDLTMIKTHLLAFDFEIGSSLIMELKFIAIIKNMFSVVGKVFEKVSLKYCKKVYDTLRAKFSYFWVATQVVELTKIFPFEKFHSWYFNRWRGAILLYSQRYLTIRINFCSGIWGSWSLFYAILDVMLLIFFCFVVISSTFFIIFFQRCLWLLGIKSISTSINERKGIYR